MIDRCGRGIPLSGLLVAVVACAGQSSSLVSPAKFVGAPIEQAIARWGTSYARTPGEDGSSEFTWRYAGVRLVRTSGGPPATSGAGGGTRFGTPVEPARRDQVALIEEHCVLSFMTDAQSIIATWRAEGEACIHALSEPGAFASPAAACEGQSCDE